MELTRRKNPRLEGYNYTGPGHYFVTVCTAARYENILCAIHSGRSESDPVSLSLTPAGEIVHRYIHGISRVSPGLVQVDDYVIMPDHIHLLLRFLQNDTAENPVSLPNIINSLKGLVTKELGYSIWQRSYHDHIIRSKAELQSIRKYIKNNPENWIFKVEEHQKAVPPSLCPDGLEG